MNIKLKNDNRGIAMVSVMIVATVCLLVATIVLEITYTSLMSRRVYKTANDNMYSAETTVDDMESVIQNVAYFAVGQNAKTSDSFIEVAQKILMDNAGVTSFSSEDDRKKLATYIYDNLDERNKEMLGSKDATGKYVIDHNKFQVSAVGKGVSSVDTTQGSLAISVSFKYVDKRGFSSNIKTDLVLNDITVRKGASDYNLGSYSMFNGGGLKVYGESNHCGLFRQHGNAYIGQMDDSAPNALEITDVVAVFEGAAIINGDVHISDMGALLFTAGMDDDGNKTEVTINGTVYVDDSSVLNISDKINFMCKDIMLEVGGKYVSFFSGEIGTLKSGAVKYSYMYPYKLDNGNYDYLNSNNQLSNYAEGDFNSAKATGCVMLQDQANAYVVKYDTTTKKCVSIDGKYNSDSLLLNRDPLCTTTAKTTIWTYDNNQIVVDSELAKFVNPAVLYYQENTAESLFLASNTSFINKDALAKTTFNIAGATAATKGSDCTDLRGVGSLTTVDIATKDTSGYKNMKYNVSNGSQSAFEISKVPGYTKGNITISGQTFDKVSFKVGEASDVGFNLDLGTNAILMACVYNTYNLQGSGGKYCGIVISCKRTEYKIQAGKKIEGYSILNAAKEDQAKIEELIDAYQYAVFINNSVLDVDIKNADGSVYELKGNAAGYSTYYEDLYKLCMLDNLFVNGVKSFKGDNSGSSGGTVSVNTNNMYDFITVENWTQE